ncbi:MAG TPA: translation elongation factor Ts [Candidatus Andersenbacteria bacterium]|nr:translation elongation factor Ts [Candidatus Andersenbacteria bacterium]
MTTITVGQVKELRALTGCALMDCKEALAASNGDIEQAIMQLRTKGKTHAAKKSARPTAEGAIVSYVHSNGKIGVLVSLLCETDFVSRNEKFQALARDLALHIAAMDPTAVSPEDIPATLLAAEEAIATEQAKTSGKPFEIQQKMIEGKLNKFRAERALLTQSFVKDPNKTITNLINEAIAELGENISVAEFRRLSI